VGWGVPKHLTGQTEGPTTRGGGRELSDGRKLSTDQTREVMGNGVWEEGRLAGKTTGAFIWDVRFPNSGDVG